MEGMPHRKQRCLYSRYIHLKTSQMPCQCVAPVTTAKVGPQGTEAQRPNYRGFHLAETLVAAVLLINHEAPLTEHAGIPNGCQVYHLYDIPDSVF